MCYQNSRLGSLRFSNDLLAKDHLSMTGLHTFTQVGLGDAMSSKILDLGVSENRGPK